MSPLTLNGSIAGAVAHFLMSDEYRRCPLQVRDAFRRVATWLPSRDASFPVTAIDSSFAKMLRDRASRERGYKFNNHTLVLIQVVVARAVDTGMVTHNRVRQIPKLPPPPRPTSTCRRRIRPVRQSTPSVNLLKRENSSA
jgi:hypothetical protein